MAEANSINLFILARQTREVAIHQAEEKYKNDLAAAAGARDSAVREAMAAKAEALNQAGSALDFSKKRLSESRDRIEARLRKQDLDEVRRIQEQMLIKAEDNRVKSLKLADELGKHLATEAVETRRRVIQQAYDNEKKMKLKAEQALKIQKKAARYDAEEKRKSRQRTQQDAVEAKTRGQKAAVAERSAQAALDKTREKAQKQELSLAKRDATPELPESGVKASIINSEAPGIPAGRTKSKERGSSISRQGTIKLTVIHKDGDSDHMIDFENSLRKIPDIHLVMVGGTKDGAQILVTAEHAIDMSEILRQLPVVENVNDRKDDILINLKSLVIFQNNT